LTSQFVGRLTIHKGKLASGFTRRYGVVMLVYYEEYSSVTDARARELTLKRWRRQWKFKLIESLNPDWRDLTDDLAI
jgi:putative endonuclease